MRKDREQANILRKSGMSYSEIISRMGVPRSTLSSWFHDQKWSNDLALECIEKAKKGTVMRLMVLNTIRGNRLKKIYEDAKQDAFLDFLELKYHPLFISGIMMYWAHGDKTSKHRISISSSDKRVIRIFFLFLDRICGLKKIKVRLLIEKTQDEGHIKASWVEKTGLKYESFGKTGFINAKKGSNSKKIVNNEGVCNIILTSAYLKSKILKWIELLAEEIGEEKYFAQDNNAGIV